MNDTCIEFLKNEETENALDCLKRAEQILEDHTHDGKEVDRNMIIIVLYNEACCYQRQSMLDECSNYLDGTIYNLQQKLLTFEDQEHDINEMIEQADNEYGFKTENYKQRITSADLYGLGDDEYQEDDELD